MIAVEFPQANCILAKDQPEYDPLPVHIDVVDPARPMTCCFQLNKEEIDEIVKTGKIWFTQLTFGQLFHPISMSTQNPFIKDQN